MSLNRRDALRAAVAAGVGILRAQFSTAIKRDGTWNLLFPRGTWHGANLAPIGGSIDLSSGLLEEMVANWKAAGSPPLPIRKTHRHLDDDVPAVDRAELERSFGWLTDLRATNEGLEALTEWTPAGKACVEAGEFAFWSPEWQPKHVDRRTGEVRGWWLSGTALTNDPFFNEMPPVAAAVLPTDPPAAKEHPMNEQQLNALRASLGLSATATVEEVLAAASKMSGEAKALKAAAEKAPTITAQVTEAVTTATAPLVSQLKSAEAELLDMKVTALIASAQQGDGKTGRAIVAEKVKPVLLKLVATESTREEGLKTAAAYLEAIPATLPLQFVGKASKDEGALTPELAQKKIAARAEELRASGATDATMKAIIEMPDVARIASSN